MTRDAASSDLRTPGGLPLDLPAQIAWFNRLRFVAVVGMVTLALVARALGVLEDPRAVFGMAALTLVVNLVHVSRFRAVSSWPPARQQRHVYLQIALDLAILTGVLHATGGVTNPLVLFYSFHAFIAALVLSVRAALVVAAASWVLMALLGFGELTGVLPHRPMRFRLLSLDPDRPGDLGLWLAALGMTLGFSVYFVSTVVARLVRRENELVRLSGQLAQSEKLASIGTLAAGLSHEINNPVGVIQSRVQILRYRIADGDDRSRLLAELDVIERHAERIGAVVQGLLAFARETPFVLGRVDLEELVAEGMELVRVSFREAGVELHHQRSGRPVRVRGSPNHLLQVLVNLLLNAKDACEDGGGRVVVGLESGAGRARVWIRDNGVGIPADVLPKIFDPFFTTKDTGRGTGLGLAISHGIVQRHGGHLEVATAPGQGTTFVLDLPLEGVGSEPRPDS